MPKRKEAELPTVSRWMNECDIIRYNLRIPEDLKNRIREEALERKMDMSTYVCGLLTGDIKRKKLRKQR